MLFVKLCDCLAQSYQRSKLDLGKEPVNKVSSLEVARRKRILLNLLSFELIW